MLGVSNNSENVFVCHVEPWVLSTLRRRAEYERISIESYIRQILKETALQRQETLAGKSLSICSTTKQSGNGCTGSIYLLFIAQESAESDGCC